MSSVTLIVFIAVLITYVAVNIRRKYPLTSERLLLAGTYGLFIIAFVTLIRVFIFFQILS